MSITDELRKWVDEYGCEYGTEKFIAGSFGSIGQDKLLAIADCIDKEHAEAVADALQLRGEPDRWVKLPVDADGVPIHVGDEMKGEKIGGGFGEPFEVVGYIMSNGELEPMDEHKCPRKRVYLHHHQPDSWEHIIKDAQEYVTDDEPLYSVSELVERCRRLAGEAE